jgi:hypothetical protein
MKKIKLIIRQNEFTSFTSYYLKDFWRRWFDIECFDASKTYDNNTLFAIGCANVHDDYSKKLQTQNRKIIIDNLWEIPQGQDEIYCITHPYWFRLNESLWWRALNYHQYRPNKKHQYLALMPMNGSKPYRDVLFEIMEPLLEQFLWSYRGQRLPNDGDYNHGEWQRYMNPDWYDSCYCSVVAETQVDHSWITEKSCKPLAYFHPALILSGRGQLQELKKLGFATFDNIFDESYDNEINLEKRCRLIFENLKLTRNLKYDPETQRRLQHNHAHFFDRALVESIIEKEIVFPLLEYANHR